MKTLAKSSRTACAKNPSTAGIAKLGFTIIEITLALAITSAMLVAFMGTIASRISRERYSDATKGFADALRQVYSEVENVEIGRSGSLSDQNEYCTLSGQAAALSDAGVLPSTNNGDDGYAYAGRSDCAIYGKLISFGDNDNNAAYHVYDVIGRSIEFRGTAVGESVISSLKAVYADVLSFTTTGSSTTVYSLQTAGAETAFYPTWDSWLEDTDGNKFTGEILIVRSPISGAVHTYYLNKTLNFQNFISRFSGQNSSNLRDVVSAASNEGYDLSAYFVSDNTDPTQGFVTSDIDFCVGSNEFLVGVSYKNNLRIVADGHDSSAIELVETDSEDNKCK